MLLLSTYLESLLHFITSKCVKKCQTIPWLILNKNKSQNFTLSHHTYWYFLLLLFSISDYDHDEYKSNDYFLDTDYPPQDPDITETARGAETQVNMSLDGEIEVDSIINSVINDSIINVTCQRLWTLSGIANLFMIKELTVLSQMRLVAVLVNIVKGV